MMQYGDEILLKEEQSLRLKGMLCMPGGKVKRKKLRERRFIGRFWKKQALRQKEHILQESS